MKHMKHKYQKITKTKPYIEHIHIHQMGVYSPIYFLVLNEARNLLKERKTRAFYKKYHLKS